MPFQAKEGHWGAHVHNVLLIQETTHLVQCCLICKLHSLSKLMSPLPHKTFVVVDQNLTGGLWWTWNNFFPVQHDPNNAYIIGILMIRAFKWATPDLPTSQGDQPRPPSIWPAELDPDRVPEGHVQNTLGYLDPWICCISLYKTTPKRGVLMEKTSIRTTFCTGIWGQNPTNSKIFWPLRGQISKVVLWTIPFFVIWCSMVHQPWGYNISD